MAYVEPACFDQLASAVTAALPGAVLCKCRPQCKGGAWVLRFQHGLQRVDVRFLAEIGFVIDRHGVHRTVGLAADATVAALTEAGGPQTRTSAQIIIAQIMDLGRLGIAPSRIAEQVGVAPWDVRLTLAAMARGEI
jgi:hypothetical protein